MRKIKNIIIILIIIAMICISMMGICIADSNAITELPVTNPTVLEKISETNKAIVKSLSVDQIGNSEEIIQKILEEEKQQYTVEDWIEYYCNIYGVPYDIAISISRLETGWFKSDAFIYKNNVGGLSKNEIPMSFSNLESGVEAFISNLYNNYFSIGLDTPEKIGKKYCPVDPSWANKVKGLMKYE